MGTQECTPPIDGVLRVGWKSAQASSHCLRYKTRFAPTGHGAWAYGVRTRRSSPRLLPSARATRDSVGREWGYTVHHGDEIAGPWMDDRTIRTEVSFVETIKYLPESWQGRSPWHVWVSINEDGIVIGTDVSQFPTSLRCKAFNRMCDHRKEAER